jgi:two-component system sensor histidine kinase CreC
VETRQGLGESEPLELDALLRDTVAAAEPRMRQKELRVDTAFDAAVVRGDRFLLGQACANLLDNAIDFSPNGARIGLSLRREGGQWLLQVEDEGPGIPEFARERVFERFYSLPRPDGSRSSGIGLSFVKEVAALHGGSIALTERESGGACAELRLPAAN